MDICDNSVSNADPQRTEETSNDDSAMAVPADTSSDAGNASSTVLPVGVPCPTIPTGNVKVGNAIMLSPIRKVRTPGTLNIHRITPKSAAPKSARPLRLRDVSIGKRHLINRKRDASGERVRTLSTPSKSVMDASYANHHSSTGKREKIQPRSVIFSKRRKVSRNNGGTPVAAPVPGFEIHEDENDKAPEVVPDPWALDERSHNTAVGMARGHGYAVTPGRDVMAVITPPSRKISLYPYGLAPMRASSDGSMSPASLSSDNSPSMIGLVDRTAKSWFATNEDGLYGRRIMSQPPPVPGVLEHGYSPGSPLTRRSRRFVDPYDDEMLFGGSDSGVRTEQAPISTVRSMLSPVSAANSYEGKDSAPPHWPLIRPLAELPNATGPHVYNVTSPVSTASKPDGNDDELKPLSSYVSVVRGSSTSKAPAVTNSTPSEMNRGFWEDHRYHVAVANARAVSSMRSFNDGGPQVGRKSVFREEFSDSEDENHRFDDLENDDDEMLF
ncbi:hypothetical protein K440DRAFT_664710 [Wilcoxina mikolae CBS 423.85]|nr:hypothetical protein K440DRAFT_664710 [Wilcoxina mikolae CBS 423.85]